MQPVPIEYAFQKVEDGVALSKAVGDTVTKHNQVHIGYNLMHKTGRIGYTCDRWHKKISMEKTWFNLKTHFKAANQDQCLNATVKDSDYASISNDDQIDQFEDAHKKQTKKWSRDTTVANTADSLASLAESRPEYQPDPGKMRSFLDAMKKNSALKTLDDSSCA